MSSLKLEACNHVSCSVCSLLRRVMNTEAWQNLFSYSSLVHAVSGAVGTAVAMTACYPLDTARARLQIDDAQKDGFSLFILSQIVKQEGFFAIYRGLFPLVCTLCCSNFIYFYTFNGLKAVGSHGGAGQSALKDLLFAFIAGSVNVLMTAPLWVVNTRLKFQGAKLKTKHYRDAQRHTYSGIIDALYKIGRQEGMRGLWSGTIPSLVLVINPAVQFMVYELLKRQLLQVQNVEQLSGVTYFILGAISKMVATFLTYPVQVVQSKLRIKHDKKERQMNMIETFKEIFRNRGIAGLFKGLEAKLSQTVLTAALLFLVYEKIAAFIFLLMRQEIPVKKSV